MNASKSPSKILIIINNVKLSKIPETRVQALHARPHITTMNFLFTLSEKIPAKIPNVAKGAVKASPERAPYALFQSGA